jgi:hypothetical protein
MKLENFMVKIMIFFLFGGNLIWKFALIGDFPLLFLRQLKDSKNHQIYANQITWKP